MDDFNTEGATLGWEIRARIPIIQLQTPTGHLLELSETALLLAEPCLTSFAHVKKHSTKIKMLDFCRLRDLFVQSLTRVQLLNSY